MRLMPVFRRDELRETLTDALEIFALVRPDASVVCIHEENSKEMNI